MAQTRIVMNELEKLVNICEEGFFEEYIIVFQYHETFPFKMLEELKHPQVLELQTLMKQQHRPFGEDVIKEKMDLCEELLKSVPVKNEFLSHACWVIQNHITIMAYEAKSRAILYTNGKIIFRIGSVNTCNLQSFFDKLWSCGISPQSGLVRDILTQFCLYCPAKFIGINGFYIATSEAYFSWRTKIEQWLRQGKTTKQIYILIRELAIQSK